MEGRYYRLRRRNAVNYFGPAQYEAAVRKIDRAFSSNAVQKAEIKTDDTSISPIILEVLKYNGYTPEKVDFFAKRIQYKFKNRTTRDEVVNLLQLMKNDQINDVDFSGDIPVGKSVNGIDVPLRGYSSKQAQSGDKGVVTIGAGETADEEAAGEKSSPNWILIGGIAVIGIIVLLAVIKLIKK